MKTEISVTHNLADMTLRVRIDIQEESIESIVSQLERKSGTSATFLNLSIRDISGSEIRKIPNDTDLDKPLAYFGFFEGNMLHITDTNPDSIHRSLQSDEAVPKFHLSDEAYLARQDNAKSHVQKIREEIRKQKQQEHKEPAKKQVVAAIPEHWAIGDRVQLRNTSIRGLISCMDTTQEKFVGILLDEPFVRPEFRGLRTSRLETSLIAPESQKGSSYKIWVHCDDVEVGEFSEIDPFDCDEI
eukprot:GHVP01005151.1.p1 GENE.GHVP01005151.1~~GHVP01005151.1.p1  ORF type:complete len:243 (-),score=50.48 GHVP01005151.1:952-1680(-)